MGHPTEVGLCQPWSQPVKIQGIPPEGALTWPHAGTLYRYKLPPTPPHQQVWGHSERAQHQGQVEAHHRPFIPHGHSVNEGIDSTLCSLQYTTVDQMARVVAYLGTGAMLAKVDIESEYRLIPVHPQDRPLQAMPIRGEYLYRPHTPIQSPKIFNAVTDALIWHLHQTGIPHVEHYLDDYFIAGLPNSKQCQESLGVLNRECNTLGVRAAAH